MVIHCNFCTEIKFKFATINLRRWRCVYFLRKCTTITSKNHQSYLVKLLTPVCVLSSLCDGLICLKKNTKTIKLQHSIAVDSSCLLRSTFYPFMCYSNILSHCFLLTDINFKVVKQLSVLA